MIKRFLTGCFLILLFLDAPAQNLVGNQSNGLSNSSWDKLPEHPRLFANNARIAAILKQNDKITFQLLEILKNDVEKKLDAGDVVYPGGVSNMGASRNVQGRMLALALHYRLTGDKRSLEKARLDLLHLAELKNWGTSHFLDVGEAALAAGVGFDWLYKELSAEEKQKIAAAIKNNAILPALETKEGGNSWVTGNFNWNPVCNGGVMVGALAIAEIEPALARQVTDRAIKNIPFAGEAYAVDGAFPEGPSYWAYGTSFYVIAIEALRSALGTSFDLEKMPGFLKTADYNNQMVGPTGNDFNYSDYHIELQNEPIMVWFAKELKRPDLIKDELTDISRYYEFLQTGKNAKPGKKVALGRHTPFEILWWEPSLLNAKASTKAPLHWSPKGHLSMGVMRSSWDDPKATYVALKGGTPDYSHGHMDAGSFILEADGVRWALDLGTESYDKMRAAKLDLWNYSQNSNRWSTFRVGPEAHNILRFNNEYQLTSGKAEVSELPDRNGIIGNKADLSPLYSNYAEKVERTILLYPDKSVLINDEWLTKEKMAEVSFQWLTKAKVSKKADGLLLQQDGQSLHMKIENPASNNFTIEVQDVSLSTKIQDSDNPGLSRIVIKTNTAAHSKGQIRLKVYPGSVFKGK